MVYAVDTVLYDVFITMIVECDDFPAHPYLDSCGCGGGGIVSLEHAPPLEPALCGAGLESNLTASAPKYNADS